VAPISQTPTAHRPSGTPRPTINNASKQHISFALWLTAGKGQFHFFIGRNAGSASDFYYQKARFIIPAGQFVICGIAVGMDRPSVLGMGFRRGEKGGSGEVFVE